MISHFYASTGGLKNMSVFPYFKGTILLSVCNKSGWFHFRNTHNPVLFEEKKFNTRETVELVLSGLELISIFSITGNGEEI